MLAARGILTSSGGRTSHAALVARQFGKPAVVGATDLHIDLATRTVTVDGLVILEGEWLSIDGNTGAVYLDQLPTESPDLDDPWLATLLDWADDYRKMGVRANADEPADAERARHYGVEGIGLCRTEHMFFDPDRLPVVRQLIMADTDLERREALDQLLGFQRADILGLLEAMDGLPVIIRLLDPPTPRGTAWIGHTGPHPNASPSDLRGLCDPQRTGEGPATQDHDPTGLRCGRTGRRKGPHRR